MLNTSSTIRSFVNIQLDIFEPQVNDSKFTLSKITQLILISDTGIETCH